MGGGCAKRMMEMANVFVPGAGGDSDSGAGRLRVGGGSGG